MEHFHVVPREARDLPRAKMAVFIIETSKPTLLLTQGPELAKV